MTEVLIYTRLSTIDLHEATDRQEAACRAYAEARGWGVLDVLTDTATSAYDPRAKRPGFDALFEEARNRTCDGVLVWKFDRLVRRPADFEALWTVADGTGVFLASVMEPIDTSTPLGVAMLRILVALAGLESATTGVRVAATKRLAAERGEPPKQKAYGLTSDWRAEVPEEAQVIREAASRAIAGETLAAIARDFRFRGIPAARGGHFSDGYLHRLLRSPRLAGDSTYRGAVVARDCWPAVLDRDTYDQLQLVLALPERLGAPRRHHRRLATGFATCGLCGHPMSTTTRNGDRYYSCPTQPTGCGRMHVIADGLETWLLGQLAARLSVDYGPVESRAPKLGVGDRAAALRQLAIDYYGDHVIDRDEFLAARAVLVREPDAGVQHGVRDSELRRLLRAPDRSAALQHLPLDKQRALLAGRLDRLVVSRTVARRHGLFDPGRLRCEWRQPEAELEDGVT